MTSALYVYTRIGVWIGRVERSAVPLCFKFSFSSDHFPPHTLTRMPCAATSLDHMCMLTTAITNKTTLSCPSAPPFVRYTDARNNTILPKQIKDHDKPGCSCDSGLMARIACFVPRSIPTVNSRLRRNLANWHRMGIFAAKAHRHWCRNK